MLLLILKKNTITSNIPYISNSIYTIYQKKKKEQYKCIKLHSTFMYLQSTILYQTLGQKRQANLL